ncbi:cupredoxin domain-containing protein [Pseudoroseomonas cervicalis]|uniref:Copper-binding protein, plastocyanin/azurin family n=1 Tax=Pseudoroseomonas cervicalis ATCC 49957 TaxID=525371 RepID=D5RQR9_9PROT|nr:cupredoxin domain-containing protein [Pseudoroseomonas cervicalis]EFH10319.1 copper-binding protein, plastocyanin/azurin family [Pseudoroseomonas cervicalis ATCC 49957]
MRLVTSLAVAVVALGAVAAQPAAADSAYEAFGARGRAQDAKRTVDIVMRDNSYQPQRIQVRAGETVRFRVRNAGELLHEFNIGTAAMHRQHQREMQAMFDSGMMSATSKDAMAGMDHSRMAGMNHGAATMGHDDPNAVLVNPGQTGEMVFKFTRAAELEFACNIPGHYESGMVGNVVFTR